MYWHEDCEQHGVHLEVPMKRILANTAIALTATAMLGLAAPFVTAQSIRP
jgi:hypothetical protein